MRTPIRRLVTLLCPAALLLIGACSREAPREQVSDAAENMTSAVRTEAWIDDVQLSGAEPTAGTSVERLTPGTELQLSMSVADAPQGTVVTAYWYGPENRQLAYESQIVEPQQRQMKFIQENTHDWTAGTYHTEVWVGQDKVEEQTFEMVAG